MTDGSGMTGLVLTGAGNVRMTRRILSDLLVVPGLAGTLRIALHDIDDERLRTAEAMARAVARELDAAPTVTTHADRRSALDGADHVLNMVQIGGLPATLLFHSWDPSTGDGLVRPSRLQSIIPG